ncbi:ribonuclease H-like domain-containing protein [Cerioporus squamosus]|nr:ribonuclease H-like domain-containing protein [Cerioporus squamosus]
MSQQKFPVPPADKFLALSTTSVGCGPGGGTPMIARVALVDYRGQIVFCTYVQPTNPVTDYRTSTTGIQASDLQPADNALPWKEVQQRVAQLIMGKIIVGHTLWQDLSVLGIRHPAVATRDVALYQPFRNALRSPNHTVGLQTLMWHLMRRRVQENHVCPLENARAALDLYRSYSNEWEQTIAVGQWPSQLPPSTFSRCYQ